MTLLDELKRQKARRKKAGKKKAAKRRKKRAKKKAAPKRRKKRATKKRAKKRAPVKSFGAMMRQGGKRKLNVAKTRTRIKNLYKQGELAQANKLRAKLKAAGYEYKA